MRQADESEYRAVSTVLFRYAEFLDAGDYAGVAALFDPNGEVRVASASAVKRGQAEIRDLMASLCPPLEDGRPGTMHVVTNVQIDVDRERCEASSRSYVMVLVDSGAGSFQIMARGRYEDMLRLSESGWRFSSRVAHVDLPSA